MLTYMKITITVENTDFRGIEIVILILSRTEYLQKNSVEMRRTSQTQSLYWHCTYKRQQT